MQEIGQGQQVGGAAGGEVSLHKGRIQLPQPLLSGKGLGLQQFAHVPGNPLLGFIIAAGDEVGIHRLRQHCQEGGAACVVQGQTPAKSLLQPGQTHLHHRREACLRLTPDAGDAVAQIELLAHGLGVFRGQSGKIQCGKPFGHPGAFPEERFRVRFSQPSRRTAEESQGENGPLVGIDAAGGPEHLPLRRKTRSPKLPEGFGGRKGSGLHAGGGAVCKIGP